MWARCTKWQVHVYSRHFNFTTLLNNFWILWLFNFGFQPEYYISPHFDLASDIIHNLLIWRFYWILKFLFWCAWFYNISGTSWKLKKPKIKVKYIFILFCTHLTYKCIKNVRKTSFWFENIFIFIIWVYNWIYKSHNLRSLLLWKWAYKARCKILLF